MNKIKRKEKGNGIKKIHLKERQKDCIQLLNEENFQIEIELEKESLLEISQYSKNASGRIQIYLKGEDSKIEYHYNTVNQTENKLKVEVFHESPKTESRLFLHGWNQEEQALSFLVNVYIPKGMHGSVAQQENRIYNEKKGKALIEPTLFIDEFDVEASHSSFTGPFEETSKFYLKTRGLEEDQINHLLLEGFLEGKELTEEEKFHFFQKRKEG